MAPAARSLDEALVRAFGAALRGGLLRPRDPGYEAARSVWNAAIDRRPAMIARCAGAADVILAVDFARANNLLASVRGGGHSVAGFAVCDDGLMIDLSGMKGIRVDQASRAARAEPGVTVGEFDRETQAFGLATTGGFVPSTGIAGLTLGGGFGHLMRRFGLTCDNLLAADLVTADGQLRKVSATENEDLFWGIRGGGGNFGIVTSFEYRLHPVGPTVLGGLILHPLSAEQDVMRFYREFAPTAPDELTTQLAWVTMPGGDPVVGFLVCYSGPLEQGDAVIRALREFGSPLVDTVGPMPYTELQALGGPMAPPGRFNYWKSSFIQDLSDAAVNTIAGRFGSAPSPYSVVFVEQLGGAVSRVGRDETAFGERGARYSLFVASAWTEQAEADENVRWTRDLWGAMRPFESEAAYVNYLDADEQDRTRAVYGGRYERLAALKKKYDPTNFFRLNQNIKPAG
jgi:FAD/FMN-containing dehydrogenase